MCMQWLQSCSVYWPSSIGLTLRIIILQLISSAAQALPIDSQPGVCYTGNHAVCLLTRVHNRTARLISASQISYPGKYTLSNLCSAALVCKANTSAQR